MVLATAIVSQTALLCLPVRFGEHCLKQKKSFLSTPRRNVQFRPVAGLKPLGLCLQTYAMKNSVSRVLKMKRASMTCSASMSATCAAMQTQTVVDNRKTIDSIPTKGETKFNNNGGDTPKLDDTGGNPPHNGEGGWGGGGGGEGPFYGGFYLFLFLAFVTWLNEETEKSEYIQNHRKRITQQFQ